MGQYVCAVDAGTTGVTVVLYDRALHIGRRFYREFVQHYPRAGWVEHDANEIADVTVNLLREAVEFAGSDAIDAIGITNQRETTVAFDRATGEPLAPAIVWQCRRTSERCSELRGRGLEATVRDRTGLTLDPYFSATKMEWLQRHVPAVSRAAERGELAFATIDSWLIYRLSGGVVHATDPTNAARTMLFDIHAMEYDEELLRTFSIRRASLPEVRPSGSTFGVTAATVVGVEVPILGVLGDQQAALYGQGCFEQGFAKNTYGTGCFLLSPAREGTQRPPEGLLLTVGADAHGSPMLVLEGSVFIGGAVVQWLRDGLGTIASSSEVEEQANTVADAGDVVFVPAFTGLGAPYWDAEARGAILGLTRGTTREHLARAAIDAIAHQVEDLLEVFAVGLGARIETLRVDGGAATDDLLMQRQADLSNVRVMRPCNVESTSLGAAALAATRAGWFADPREAEGFLEPERTFAPMMNPGRMLEERDRWRRAVACVRAFGSGKATGGARG
ncbi:MAG: glycerol kinase GlpK [Planctomycetes bacterium]|nr:glycerol kinase GlpK [Planctomycetota bacterium]